MQVFLGDAFHDGWFLFALGHLFWREFQDTMLPKKSAAFLLVFMAHASIPLDISVSFQKKKYFMIK